MLAPDVIGPPSPGFSEMPSDESSVHIKDLVYTVWEGKWIVLAVFIVIVGGMVAWLYSQAPEYESHTLLLVSTDQGPVTQGLDVGLEDVIGLQDRTLQNEIFVISQSLALSEAVAGQMQLIRTLPQSEEPPPVLYNADGTPRSVPALARTLGSMIWVSSEGRDVDALRITARSTNAAEAALVANVYAAEYIERTQESSRARITASRSFLEEQEEARRAQLQDLEDQVRAYMTRSGAVALDQEASSTVSQIAILEASRDEARIELGMERAKLGALEGELSNLEPRLRERITSSAQAELDQVQRELITAEYELEELLLANPTLRDNLQATTQTASLANRIERLRQRVQELGDRVVDESLASNGIDVSPQGDGFSYIAQRRRQIAESEIAISGLEARVGAISSRLGGLQGKLQSIPTQAIELAQLQRARQSVERLYIYIVEKLQEVRIAEQSEIGYAEVIRPAFIPASPVYPNKTRTTGLAIAIALVLGIGLVLLRKSLDTRLHTPSDLRELGQTVLGVIPDMRAHIKKDFGGRETIEAEGLTVSTTASVLLDPMSSTTEAYRRLRTNIQFSRPDAIVQTILLSSAEMGEGKTTTVINLGLAMAQANRRVCLVDCDLRRPRLHDYLGQSREPGLTELLFNHDGAAFDPERYRLPIDDFFLIPAGAKVPNPAEVLGSRRMRELVEELREHFDIILFDTPPLLAFSEAMLLATQCDGSVVVGTADKTEKEALAHAIEMLAGVGAPILGAVLNGIDVNKQQRYGYGYYKYRYGYRYYGSGYYNAENRSA